MNTRYLVLLLVVALFAASGCSSVSRRDVVLVPEQGEKAPTPRIERDAAYLNRAADANLPGKAYVDCSVREFHFSASVDSDVGNYHWGSGGIRCNEAPVRGKGYDPKAK